MPDITPCLWFDDQGEDAAEHYCSIFPNSKVTHVERYNDAGPKPAGEVMVVAFELDGKPFVALNGGPQFTFSDGGEEGPCGWLKDRYGLSWQIVPTRLKELLSDHDSDRAARAMKAMMAMKKIDIAAVEAAADAAGAPA